MLYSSCKNPVVDQVKQRAGLEVAKTVRHVRVSAVAVEVGGGGARTSSSGGGRGGARTSSSGGGRGWG